MSASQPQYPVRVIKSLVPTLDLPTIGILSSHLQEENKLYTPEELRDIYKLLAKRIIELRTSKKLSATDY